MATNNNPLGFGTWGSKEGQTWLNGKKFQQTFDQNGMVNGGQYLDDNEMVIGNYQVDPTPIKSALTGDTSGKSATETAYWDGLKKSTDDALGSFKKSIEDNQARSSEVWKAVNNLKNPYDASTPQYQQGLASLLNQTNRRANTQQAQQMGAIGGSTGLRQALGNSLNNQRYAALSDAEGSYTLNAINQGANYDMSKTNLLASVGRGDYSGATDAYARLASMPYSLEALKNNTKLEADKMPYILKSLGLDNEGKALTNQGLSIGNEQATAQLRLFNDTYQAAKRKAEAGASLTEEETRQLKFVNDNAWILAIMNMLAGAGSGIGSSMAGGGAAGGGAAGGIGGGAAAGGGAGAAAGIVALA